MADRDTATGVLGLIQAFVNSVDLQDGPEELSHPDALKAWLVAHELMEAGPSVSEADLRHAIAVRESRKAACARPMCPAMGPHVTVLAHAGSSFGGRERAFAVQCGSTGEPIWPAARPFTM